MKSLIAASVLTASSLLTGCAVAVGPAPYRGPIILATDVRPHIVAIIPLTATSYSVHYVPGLVTEAMIVASFSITCADLGRVATRGPGPTRRKVVRRGRAAPYTGRIFTVVCL